jgi:hypothetical protein
MEPELTQNKNTKETDDGRQGAGATTADLVAPTEVPAVTMGAASTSTTGETPEATMGSTVERARPVGMSGAQWRKLLRQEAIEGGKPLPVWKKKRGKGRKGGAEGATTSANTAPGTSSSGRDSGDKRKAYQRSSEESPRMEAKRAKRGDTTAGPGPSYAAAATSLPRVTLTCGGYLGKELPSEVCGTLKKALVNRMMKVEGGEFVPRFRESFARRGALVVVCMDDQSKTWLEEKVEELEVEPALKPRVVRPEDLPKIHKVGTFLPPEFGTPESFIKLLGMQNGLDTTGWVVMSVGKEKPPFLVLGVDQPAWVFLRERDFRVCAGVNQVGLKPLGRPDTTPGER